MSGRPPSPTTVAALRADLEDALERITKLEDELVKTREQIAMHLGVPADFFEEVCIERQGNAP